MPEHTELPGGSRAGHTPGIPGGCSPQSGDAARGSGSRTGATGLGIGTRAPGRAESELSSLVPRRISQSRGRLGGAQAEAVQGRGQKRRSGNSLEKQQQRNKRRARPFPAHRDELSSLAQWGEGKGERHGQGSAVRDPATLCVPVPQLEELLVPQNTPNQAPKHEQGYGPSTGCLGITPPPGAAARSPRWDKRQRREVAEPPCSFLG